jgi:chemotaxis protein methyltransferase CheR
MSDSGTTDLLPLSAGSFTRLRDAIHAELGIDLGPAKLTMLRARLQTRARELGLQTLDEYCTLVLDTAAGHAERRTFFDAVTTNKTDFFREPDHFEHLLRSLGPEPSKLFRGDRPYKIWCAACSTGEEPYTLAMLLNDLTPRGFAFTILATDVATHVLRAAQRAIYPQAQIEPIPDALRRRCLLRGVGAQSGQFRITPDVRRHVQFAQLNLIADELPPPATFDAIFLRNVLIYFDRPTRQSVVDAVSRRLRPDGQLFIGRAESIAEFGLPLRQLAPSVFRREPSRVS